MTNPSLSLWLSAANSWAGATRGFWTAEMQRQQSTMMIDFTEQWLRYWMNAWTLPTYRQGLGSGRR